MKAIRCVECKKLFDRLTQYRSEDGKLFIRGYCEECNCYTVRRFDNEEDNEEKEKED